jgi:predicted transcriptional regulator
MSTLAIDLQNMIESGYNDNEIAVSLGVSEMIVSQFREEFVSYEDRDYDDSMDGDFDSGMASAGFGTDEDYNGYTGE